MRTRLVAVPAALAAAALLLTGCVDNSSTGGTGSTSAPDASSIEVDEAAVALLPDDVAESGTLIVGIDPTYPPNEFKDADGNPIGWGAERSDRIRLFVTVGNERAAAFYRRIGFAETGHTVPYPPDPTILEREMSRRADTPDRHAQTKRT